MYGLIINLIIQSVARVTARYKLFGWWMIVSFLWASAIAWQLPPPYQGSRQFDDESIVEIGPEQSCAKAPAEERDVCLLIARIVGALRLKGAAHYTSTEKLELMLGPPFGLLVISLIGALIRHKVTSAATLTIAAISLMILSFLAFTAILTVL